MLLKIIGRIKIKKEFLVQGSQRGLYTWKELRVLETFSEAPFRGFLHYCLGPDIRMIHLNDSKSDSENH